MIYEINHIFADFNAFLSAMLTINGFSLTGSSQKLKNPWKSLLSRKCSMIFKEKKNKGIPP